MNLASAWYLSPPLVVLAWLVWFCSRAEKTSASSKRGLRLGSATLGLIATLTAAAAFVQFGLSANLERAFGEEAFSRRELDERLAHLDRLMALVASSAVAGGVVIVLALSDAARAARFRR